MRSSPQKMSAGYVLRKMSLMSAFGLMAFLPVPAASEEQESVSRQVESLSESLRPRFTVEDVMPQFTLQERMDHYGVPGVAIAVIKDGKLVHVQGFGVLRAGGSTAVDADTVFSVGSISKMVTAALVLKMQSEGSIDIDHDIRDYLTSWQLPEGDVAPDAEITLRMILSHTAGFNVHGFGDFAPGEKLPTVLDTLNGIAPATNDPLKILFEPGTKSKYSGGGYTLAQLIIADTAETSFAVAAENQLFSPLGMTRSTFANPLPATHGNIAKAHDRNGEPTALPRGWEAMPEMAASGLWTSANDLGMFVAMLIGSYRSTSEFLPQNVATDMMTKVSPSQHGLGPRLENTGQTRFFHHAGSNNSYKAWIEGHLVTGDGLVVLTNGSNGNQLFVEIRNAAADVFGWSINEPVMVPKVSIDQAVLAQFAGRFRPDENFPVALREQAIGGFFDQDLEFIVDDDELQFALFGSDSYQKLIPLANNRFLIPAVELREGIAEFVLHRGADGRATSLTFKINDAVSHYRRVSDNLTN